MRGSATFRGWTPAVVAAGALAGVVVVSLPSTRTATQPSDSSDQSPADQAGPPGASPLRGDDRDPQLQGLLQRRSAAVRNHDEPAFLATVDPKAPPEFQRRQRELFRNLSGVPLTEWNYHLAPPADPSAQSEPALAVPADDTYAPRVTLSYALAGVDVVPTSRTMGYLFARRGDSWYLAGEDEFQTEGKHSWRGPWDFGPSQVTPTRTGLVVGHPGTQLLARRVAQVLDASVGSVTQVWGPNWPQRVGVLLPDSQTELQAMVGPEFAVDGIAAVAVADRVDPAARRVEGQRIVLNPKTASQLSDQALQVVLRHEITHVAARADTVDGAPMWLLEGFADYVGYRDSGIPPSQIAPDLARQLQHNDRATLPSDRDFHLAGRSLDLAYQQSWSFVDFIARHWGERAAVDLYRRVAGSGTHATVDTALRDLTGKNTPELLAEWSEDTHRLLD